jgi:penicillin amidase
MVIATILTERPDWCTEAAHPEETCETRLADALSAALAGLRRRYGAEMAEWRWGGAHVAQFPNRVLDRIPLWGDWLKVAIPTSGGPDTVNVGPISVRDEAHPYDQRFGAGLRIVTDLAAPAESRMIVVPGQSGNPFSPHFSDLLTRWRDFGWLTPGRAAPVATLTLEPKQ